MEYALCFNNLLSGLFCIILDKELFSKIDDDYKIPLYGMIGASLAFMIFYTIVDMIEVTMEFWDFDICKKAKADHVPLVVSNLQHYFLLLATLCMGILFGVMFGAVDIESMYRIKIYMLEAAFMVELLVFAPLGLLFGAITGCIFIAIRLQELERREELKTQKGSTKKR